MIWLLSIMLILIASQVEAAALFATNNGATSGACTTSGTACRMDRISAVVACGDTVTLLNGTYQGANNQIWPWFDNKTCTAGNEITVSAETEGGVFIDGQFTQAAFFVINSSYLTFSGFDAGNVFDGHGVRSVDHITVRRVCFSNTAQNNGNNVVLTLQSMTNSTWEDICVFGTGRNTFSTFDFSGPTTGNTFRRFWVRNEGTTGSSQDVFTAQTSYFGNSSGGNIYENFILVYDPEQNIGACCEHFPGLQNRNASATLDRFLGFIVYGYDGFTSPASAAATLHFFRDGESSFTTTVPSNRSYTDIFSDSRSQTAASTGPFGFQCSLYCGSGNAANRFTGIRNTSQSSSTFTGWSTPSNFKECTSLSDCPNFYTGIMGSDLGARNCFRYTDGTLTSTSLWPWPMDDRIKAALARANTAGTGGSALSGTAGSGYAANTVTSEIVSRYGSIPTACLSGSVFTPSFPVASDFPSVSVRDDFDRANAPTLGSSWTELLSDTFSIVSNAAAAPSTGGGFARALYTDTKLQTSHEVYATWTTLAEPGGYATFLSFAGTDLTANNQYRVVINQTSGSNTLLKVQRVDGVGTATDILSAVDLGIEAVDGNSFGVRVSGTTISVYWKWTDGIWYRVGQFTDSNLSTLPSTGVYGGIAGGSPSVINNYGAGPFVDQPAQDPPTPPASSGVGRFGTTFPGVR